MADKDWRGQGQEHKADTRRTSGGQGLKARPKPTTQGGQVADKDWGRGHSQQHKADTRRASGGHKADKRRTRTGGASKANNTMRGQGGAAKPNKADKWRTQAGHMADKLRGRGQGISRPAFLFLRENPTVKCLGNYTSIDPKQFIKHRIR